MNINLNCISNRLVNEYRFVMDKIKGNFDTLNSGCQSVQNHKIPQCTSVIETGKYIVIHQTILLPW